MHRDALVTLHMRELDRLKVIQAVSEARLKPGQAAERLGLCVRQVERLVARYHAAGVAGLVSGKRGQSRGMSAVALRDRKPAAQQDVPRRSKAMTHPYPNQRLIPVRRWR
jgi:hypothetical protein